jgi:hypothetical protein
LPAIGTPQLKLAQGVRVLNQSMNPDGIESSLIADPHPFNIRISFDPVTGTAPFLFGLPSVFLPAFVLLTTDHFFSFLQRKLPFHQFVKNEIKAKAQNP